MSVCKHCSKEFDIKNIANHSRWCNLNPKRSQYNKDLSKARAAKTNFNNQYSLGKRMSEETKNKISVSSLGKTHTEATKKILKEKALASNHRRLKKGVVIYNGITLDSKWELYLAKRLDELKIEWIRPNSIPWVDKNGITHNYFPDFYLPAHDLYLDPKNPYAIEVQKDKLEVICKTYKNLIIIKTEDECKNFIR